MEGLSLLIPFYKLIFLLSKSEILMRLAGNVARIGEERGVHRVLVGKTEGKWPMGRSRSRWEDNINMDLQKVVGTGWS
jgi:hypothetical protein